ncbi:hypothetical protein [Mycoplasmoides alvi]|uniref:hypothetical protein n=1 Tax=Mycoplasmoides alvi TaxID=78580 RepID=UPI00051ACCA4|nr:hypothetical protein [Mycoplasmoides alvi]
MSKKVKIKTNDKITFWGFMGALVLGVVVGLIPYLLIKIFNLKSWFWFIPFFFIPPVIGAIIYGLSKTKVVKVKTDKPNNDND